MARKAQISVSIDQKVLNKIDIIKEKRNRSRNFIVNYLLEKALKKGENK